LIKVDCGKFGYFEYKKPNIMEGIRLTSVVFPSDHELIDCTNISNLLVAKCLKHMGPLVKNVELTLKDDEGKVVKLKDYDDMLEHYDMVPHLMTMAEDILGCLELAIKKKSGSETQQDS
jgi:hypothetical protein